MQKELFPRVSQMGIFPSEHLSLVQSCFAGCLEVSVKREIDYSEIHICLIRALWASKKALQKQLEKECLQLVVEHEAERK